MRGNRAIGGGCASKEGGAAGVVAVAAAAAAARYLFVDEDGLRMFLRQLLQMPSRGDIFLTPPESSLKLPSIANSCSDQLHRAATDA